MQFKKDKVYTCLDDKVKVLSLGHFPCTVIVKSELSLETYETEANYLLGGKRATRKIK